MLVERVVGRDHLITIPGAGISNADEIWDRALDWMEAPHSEERSRAVSGGLGLEVGAKGGVSLPLVAKVEIDGNVTAELEAEDRKSQGYRRRGLTQVVKEIANSEFVILLDDFHYMPRHVQEEAAKALKEAVRLGLKICTAAVRHRGDDVVRANPELRGRVRSLDLTYWTRPELTQIADQGFAELNATIPPDAAAVFAEEAAGSPQLMQLICLNACFVWGLRHRPHAARSISLEDGSIETILEQTTSSTDFRSLVDVLDAGPKTRGTERKLYSFTDGSDGDAYRCVLKAVAADPPRLSFDYDDLVRRTASICSVEPPAGSSLIGTCVQMSKLALERFARERAIDWDEQKLILDIPDPYLVFYLRWSGRLREAER